ncbi:MAG: hypothetical protein NT117_02535 [Gammaproteobacteria bacterium]|nr:hypothetical protein [Gammaproteobacteria bacterium]
MADLQDLHMALQLLAAAGKTAKVSFYHVGDDGKLHSGSIAVEQGQVCHVNFQQMPALEALAAITRLKFAKVSSLPAVTVEISSQPLPMTRVLELLDPRHLPAPVVVAAPVAPAKPAHVFYSHLSMQSDAQAVLEPLFGVAAEKKIEEFARLSPPMQHPQEFLERCRQHAAMMVGPKKADELFKPIYDKLNS